MQRQIGAETEEDTECDPYLPTHNEPTPNRSRCIFRCEDGDRGRLGPHTNPEQQTADEQLFPGLGEAGADDREKTEDSAEEDSTAPSEIEVEWIGKPAAAIETISTEGNLGGGLRWVIPQSGGDVWGGVHQADQPVVLVIVRGSRNGLNTKHLRK